MSSVVGIRAFKGRLSHHLHRAQAGVRLTITDRGRPIAVLSPADTGVAMAWAHEMVAKGHATWSGGKPAGLTRRIPSHGRPASRQILEDRR